MRFKVLISILTLTLGSILLSGCSLTRTKTGGLQTITAGVPYSVFLNDQFLETAPFIQKNLAVGEYSIKLEPTDANLASYETTVHVRDGLLTVITWKPGLTPEQSGGVIYEMEPISDKNKSEVSFISIPDGAIISLPNRDKQFAPLTLADLSSGEHEYEVTLPSYETQRHTLNLVSGHKIFVTVKLAKITQLPEATKVTPVPTASVSAQLTPTPKSATPTPTLTTSATASARTRQILNQDNTATSSATQTTVLILKTGLIVDGVEVLRVRQEPSRTAAEVGLVKVGQSYPYTGEQKDGWFKINFDNKTGWVSGTYTQLK